MKRHTPPRAETQDVALPRENGFDKFVAAKFEHRGNAAMARRARYGTYRLVPVGDENILQL